MKKFTFVLFAVFILSDLALAQTSKKFDLGGNLGTNYLIGDSPIENSKISPNVGIFSIYRFSPRFSLKAQIGWGQLGVNTTGLSLKTSMIPVELIGMYSFNNNGKFMPFFHAGVGIINFSVNNSKRFNDGIFIGGTGFKLSLNDRLSWLLTADMRYTTGDDFNGYNGGLKDGYFSLQSGFSYHLSKPDQFKRNERQKKSEILANLPPQSNTKTGTRESKDALLDLIQLRSRVTKLKDEIDSKDAQIEELKTLVKIKSQKIALYEAQVAELQKQKNSGAQPNYMYATRATKSPTVKPISNRRKTRTYSVKQSYQDALAGFYAKNFRTAIAKFTQLANENPNHWLTGNFIYWIGESYFGLKNYASALEAFKNVARYSRSPKLDDALLMSGICYLKLGDSGKAKQKFQELLQKFPRSEYSGKAQRYLQSLTRQVIS